MSGSLAWKPHCLHEYPLQNLDNIQIYIRFIIAAAVSVVRRPDGCFW